MLSVDKLNVIVLCVDMLSADMLNVMAPEGRYTQVYAGELLCIRCQKGILTEGRAQYN